MNRAKARQSKNDACVAGGKELLVLRNAGVPLFLTKALLLLASDHRKFPSGSRLATPFHTLQFNCF